MNKNALDRLRIVRNGIVREWQLSEQAQKGLPDNAASKKRLSSYMAGLRHALVSLYQEFDELERVPMDQKPRCPFCQEEMGHWALAKHMKEHVKKGDKIRGISSAAPGLPLDNVPMFGDITDILQGLPSAGPHMRMPGTPLHDDMEIGPIHLIEDEIFEVHLEGIKYKRMRVRASFDPHANGGWVLTGEDGHDLDDRSKYELLLLGESDRAGGAGYAMHPPKDPDPSEEP